MIILEKTDKIVGDYIDKGESNTIIYFMDFRSKMRRVMK